MVIAWLYKPVIFFGIMRATSRTDEGTWGMMNENFSEKMWSYYGKQKSPHPVFNMGKLVGSTVNELLFWAACTIV